MFHESAAVTNLNGNNKIHSEQLKTSSNNVMNMQRRRVHGISFMKWYLSPSIQTALVLNLDIDGQILYDGGKLSFRV